MSVRSQRAAPRPSAAALAAAALVLAHIAGAAAPLPPPADVDAAVRSSPVVRAARAGVDESAATAAALAAGPHEWTVQMTGQSRDVQLDQRYPEWYGGIERGMRWPDKRRLDHDLGETERQLGQARVEESERDARVDVLEAWFACLAADRRADAAASADDDARQLQEVVAKRATAGDASRAELDLAFAELAAADSEARSAAALVEQAAAALKLVGLETGCRGVAVDGLPAPPQQAAGRRPTPAVRRAQIEADRAATEAQRAVAEKHPDPLIGFRVGSEFGGGDRLAGLTITFPLPGALRRAEASKAHAHARAVEAAVAATDRRESTLRLQYEALEAEARARSEFAAADAAARGRAAEALLRGYALGDGELAAAVITRRDARRAGLTAALARIDAWRGATLAALYAPTEFNPP